MGVEAMVLTAGVLLAGSGERAGALEYQPETISDPQASTTSEYLAATAVSHAIEIISTAYPTVDAEPVAADMAFSPKKIPMPAPRFKVGQPASVLPPDCRKSVAKPEVETYLCGVKINDPGADVYVASKGKITVAVPGRTGDPADKTVPRRTNPEGEATGEDTKTGSWRMKANSKEAKHPMRKIPGKFMLWVVWTWNGQAFHESNDVTAHGYGGYRYSDGCINLRRGDAQAVFDSVEAGDMINIVEGYPPTVAKPKTKPPVQKPAARPPRG